ncbi:THC0290_0291 family protein [Psychroserpens sp. NJDZ02]|uniref:THC0290_0291 family protein n=1 Tax=Psychroserpens sp. NJDZ02 TaxID=2570561 RepID=UPI0010A8E152|nr:glutamate dehydrogenase [Psychroserpens sp. NJDZ02]QCE41391.1 glutamate dehydrogenase [Psychroserpens sp. NJDZ02]
MLNPKQLILAVLILLSASPAFSQLGFSHEIGIITGPVAFKSDFGERQDSDTNSGNTGFGIGLVHYMNFAYQANCNCYTTDNYFNDHFKLRTEISYNKTKLQHFGHWVQESKTSDEADRLRGHTGESSNFEIGMQLEFYPLSIRSFQAFGYKLAPFVSLGAHFVSYNPEVYTDYDNGTNDVGNVLDSNNFYSLWEPGSVSPESGSTWAVVSSIGVRYKLDNSSDLMLDLRGQYYFSDWVDGLDHQLNSNKNNDWLVWLNVGYIYYLD